jgi:hypothetical protein
MTVVDLQRACLRIGEGVVKVLFSYAKVDVKWVYEKAAKDHKCAKRKDHV